MQVLHVASGSLEGGGGATRGAYCLHRSLIDHGISSTFFTNSPTTLGDKSVVTTNTKKLGKGLNLLRSQSERIPVSWYKKRTSDGFSTGLVGLDLTKTIAYRKADIVHLHWINHGFINILSLKKIKKPIVWTIRDMWPMTGGCHYSMGCENYKAGCGSCGQLGSNFEYDLSKLVLFLKQKNFPQNIKVVGISTWLSEQARSSFLFKNFDIRTIFNNIDLADFFPIDKLSSRSFLGIETSKKVILVGATNPGNYYKGLDKFLESLTYLDKNKYYLCFFGNLDQSVLEGLNFECKSLGFLYDTISLRLAYSCADIFVAPSIAEAFGKTLVESMACGTPVVCFDANGPKDIVTHKWDGFKAKPFDPKSLAEGIRWTLEAPNYSELCKNARSKVIEHFDCNLIAKKYISLYEEL